MAASIERIDRLQDALRRRVLTLDGAMGTMIQQRNLGPADFGGAEYEGCNEYLVVTRPDVIVDIHRAYFDAGADIVETNTFGSTALVLDEYALGAQAYEITKRAAELARRAADEFSTKSRPRFVAGSIGPTTKAISVTGGVEFGTLRRNFAEQAEALIDGGVDYLLLETCQDTRNIKAGLLGVGDCFAKLGVRVPVAVSGTIEPMGTMLAGQTAEALVVSLAHADLLYVGLNCATGPEFMADHIRAMSDLARTRVACVPNAGLPDEDGRYLETPQMMARVLDRFLNEGWVNVVGGCCGTTPAHIAEFARLIETKAPRTPKPVARTLLSGLEVVEVSDDARPTIVGERTNSLGSRKFKRLIADGRYEEAAEIGRAQVRGGAQVLDVCLQNPDRDEIADTRLFLDKLVRMVKAPLMIDSTDHRVIEEALTYSQGKAIINSINLEDGLERFDHVVPQARRYGAALVVGCIDENKEQGMAVTRERKLEIARRSHDILTRDYGVDPADIVFDPLVFPCATGDANYLGSAVETVEGIRLIKAALPQCKTVLGISNVSFGLPEAGREVLNSVFLYHCTKAGLDMAIVNSEKLERYASIPEHERHLAEQVLFHTNDEAVAAFTAHFRAGGRAKAVAADNLTLDERLARYIVSGSKEGLVEDLERKRSEGATPLDIINGPLMAGMDEVGRLFNANELIVAEVLQSAEAMKAAVAHLQQYMEKDDTATRGTMLLATVKGDVHDIGKNLVDIIFTNNGYRVINLGIKVPPQDLIAGIEAHNPDILGLSGLLVKSAQQMVITAEELAVHGRCPPLLVGGAALSRSFTRNRIAPKYPNLTLYARDAMDGLELANKLVDPAGREALHAFVAREAEAMRKTKGATGEAEPRVHLSERSTAVRILDAVPTAPDYERHVMRRLPIDVWGYINPKMLYGKHLGFRGDFAEALAAGDEKAVKLNEAVEAIKAESKAGGAHPLTASAVWRWFPASSAGNTLFVHDPTDPAAVLHEFVFPRQAAGDGLCLADYVRPRAHPGERDNVCLFVVTAGAAVRGYAEAFKQAGAYLNSHVIQALALETAEAAAEWLHAKIRGQWGTPDDPTMPIAAKWRAEYAGKRYSFGYPACPDLSMQRPLFNLLTPEDIGVTLTEEFMMEPEASVSALVFHHPDARYFGVGESG